MHPRLIKLLSVLGPLVEGSVRNLADLTEWTSDSVRSTLYELRRLGLVQKLGVGRYSLTAAGRAAVDSQNAASIASDMRADSQE